jgi:hypothetical protein
LPEPCHRCAAVPTFSLATTFSRLFQHTTISVSWFKFNATRAFYAPAVNEARNGVFSCPERTTMSAQVLHNATWPPAARIGFIARLQVTIDDQLAAHPIHNDHPSEPCSRHGHLQVPCGCPWPFSRRSWRPSCTPSLPSPARRIFPSMICVSSL